METGVNKYAADTGMNVFQKGPAETDATMQAQVIQDLIAQGVDAICVVPVDPGAQIAEGTFERVLAFCGTGMGIHIAASKCPHVHAAVCESVPAARRCAAANNANLLAMGAFYVAPRTAMAMADAFLESSLGSGYEAWDGFYEYHRIGYDECENFDYEAYKANGFEVVDPGFAVLAEQPKGLAY